MADEFPSTQYLNQGNQDPNLGYLGGIGDIFGTGLFQPRNDEPWTPYVAPNYEPTGQGVIGEGGNIGYNTGGGGYPDQGGGSVFGNAGTGSNLDLGLGTNPGFLGDSTFFQGPSVSTGGQGVTTLPAQVTTASRVRSIISSGLTGGPLAAALNAAGQGAVALYRYFTGGNTPNPGPAVQMGPVQVSGKQYDEYGNEIPPTSVFNPPGMGRLEIGAPGVTVLPAVNVNETRLAQEEAARRAIAQSRGLANLDAYIGRQIDTGVTTMPPYIVNEGSGTGSGTIGSGSGTVSTSSGTISIGSGTSSSTGSGTVSTGSGTSSGTGSGTVGSTPNTFNFSTGPAAPVYTAPNTAAYGNRNYYNEGSQSLTDLQRLMPQIAALYGQTAQNVTTSDTNRLRGSVGDMSSINYGLTDMAAQQTAMANSALRAGNIADAQKYAQQALDLRKQSNPELYAGLSQFQNTAGNQVTSDLARLQQAQTGQLSAEDARNAQQAAREAYAARGLVMGKGAIGAEIMNRDALSRQRQNEARTNLGTSMGQLYQGIGAQTANVFDPMAAVLGQQYGMQTQNVGSNQNLFNQAAGLSSGAYGNQYAQQMTNPFNPYAQDVYNTNFNAASAQNIAGMNNAAAIEAARLSGNATTGAANTALWAGLIGSGVRGFGQGLGSAFGGG